jgi:hypothetical protein
LVEQSQSLLAKISYVLTNVFISKKQPISKKKWNNNFNLLILDFRKHIHESLTTEWASEILHQLMVCPIIHRASTIPGGAGFLSSTTPKPWHPRRTPSRLASTCCMQRRARRRLPV